MDSLWNSPLNIILERISSSDPIPGGGSASSISGLIGLSLVMMSINITRQSSSHLASAALNIAAESLEKDSIRLKELTEDDMKAFSQYMVALRLKKGTPELDSVRRQALKDATNRAINVPMSAAKLLSESLSTAKEIVPYIKSSVVSDIFAGCELIKSAAISILLNVDVNLQSQLMSDRKETFKAAKNDILRSIEGNFNYISDIAKSNGYSFSSLE
jgi:methenyltetrahydrofolate cyclohydrolase